MKFSLLTLIILLKINTLIGQCDTLNYNSYSAISCVGDTVIIPTIDLPNGRTLYEDTTDYLIPDGNGASLTPTITVSGNGGSTIQNNTDIKLCINIEHSYLGDLEILLTSPNGLSSPIINSYYGNSGTDLIPGGFGGAGIYLGGADDANTGIGICEKYCFETSPTSFPNMAVTFNTVPSSGLATGIMVEPGTYQPEDNFNTILGSPIDGTWMLTIKDNLAIDNGWICDWSLEIGENNYSYYWNTSFGMSDSTVANPIFIITQPNTYYLYTQDDSGTCLDTLVVDIILNNGLPTFPILGSNSVNEFATETYTTSYDPSLSYNWTITNGVIYSGQGTNQVDVQWYTSPNGTLKLDVYDGCNQTSDTLQVGIGYTGIDKNEQSIQIYPNPIVNGEVHYQSKLQINKIEIKNMLGQVVNTFNHPTSNLIVMNQLPKGSYILTFYNNNNTINHYKVNLIK